jgi:poly(beta-D-mannuronate) lyase
VQLEYATFEQRAHWPSRGDKLFFLGFFFILIIFSSIIKNANAGGQLSPLKNLVTGTEAGKNKGELRYIDVCSNSQLINAIEGALPGDRIRLCNGVWNDTRLIFSKSGTQAQPIVLTAQSPGDVIISGNSYIEIIGSYINVNGFRWADYGDPRPKRGFIQTSSKSRYCKISEMVFEEDIKSPREEWIFNIALRGKGHEVFNSAFLGKYGKGAQMFVWEGGQNLNHELHHLYFRRKPLGFDKGEPINGGESLQTGAGDGVELGADDFRSHHLFFEGASGESEIISVKGSRQVLSDIVMLGCEGSFSLRGGNNNIIERVFINGLNKHRAAGLRILGDNHVISDLFVTGLSDKWIGGVHFQSGIPYHDAADNVSIKYSTIIDSSDAITIGDKGIPPSNLIFDSIVVVQKTGDNRVLFVSGAEGSFRFSNSFLFGKMNVPKPGGVQISNPLLVPMRDGLYVPDTKGPASGYGCRMTQLPVYRHQTGPQTYYCDIRGQQ